MIKCVIWDLDNTLLSGVYLELPGQPPPADPAMIEVLDALSSRGIIHAIASRNPPEAAEHAAAAAGHQFAAAECGWGRKSDAIRQIADDLGLATDAVAFVDDEAYERAEVSFALPELLVLSPEDMADAAGWPEFGPAVVTPEARQRGAMYAQRRARQRQEAAFGGSREEFLRYCATSIVIGPAEPGDAARLHELSARTHQFNSAGEQLSEAEFSALIGLADQPASTGQQAGAHGSAAGAGGPAGPGQPAGADRRLYTVRLSDRFGDDGMVGGCVIDAGGQAWTVTLLMMSCRAIGRGVIDVLLAWLAHSAAQGGAAVLNVPCRLSARNVPLRLALAAAGFRATEASDPGEQSATFAKPLSGLPQPELPGWVSVPEER
jgi:methoxymalonate biosynthesis protein